MTLGYVILVLALYVLAVMRVVRLLNHDTVLDGARAWVATRAATANAAAAEANAANHTTLGDAHQARAARWNTLIYWASCPWCVGFWVCVASAFLPVWIVGWPWWALFPVGFATSHLVGVAADLSAPDDEIGFEPVR